MTDEAMKMARRIAEEKAKSHGDGRPLDFQLAYAAALAAIIETREDCARVAETLPIGGNGTLPIGGNGTLSSWVNANESPMGATRRHIAAAIRSGQQFRKDV